MHWLPLVIAVIANATANLSFKKAMVGAGSPLSTGTILTLAREPWFWIGSLAAILLLGSYLVAVRQVHVSIAYSVVTGLTLALMTLLSSWFFADRLNSVQIAGISFVILGVALISVGASTAGSA